MAIRKFVKLYGIHDSDIDDKGNVNPDAALYPYYDVYEDPKTGMTYHDLSPDQIADKLSNTDMVYDNSTNSHPDRTVTLLDPDDNTIAKVGPNLKRGYSVLAYANPEKRHGDDYFDDWYPDDDSEDGEGYFARHITSTEFTRRANNPKFSYDSFTTPEGDVDFITHSKSPEKEDSIYRVPLIVEADDSDIINYNDVVRDNYDPTRDFAPEVQLKRIIKKSVMPNTFTSQTKAEVKKGMLSKLTNLADNLSKYMADAPRKFIVDSSNKSLQEVKQLAIAAMESGCELIYSFLGEVQSAFKFAHAYGAGDYIKRLGHVISLARELEFDIAEEVSDTPACAQLVTRFFDYAKGTCDSCVPIVLKNATRPLMVASTDDTHVLKKFNDVLKEATQRGGAFDWYDSSTYSDERLKDVYSGCHDVTLSDKQLKYIYDDFKKFKKGATQNNITKGLRGLGQ